MKYQTVTKDLEAEFLRLVQLLVLKPDVKDALLELALRSQSDAVDEQDLGQAKRVAIASLKQQLANLLDLYKNGVISQDEYWRDKEDRERQIAFWEATCFRYEA